MTEQMKEALDKAAEGLQWSSGQMLLNKDTFEPADTTVVPLDKLVSVPIPRKIDVAVHFGANWYLRNVWHDAKKDEPEEQKELILLSFLNNGERSFRFGLYSSHAKMVMVSNNGDFPWLKLSHYDKWAYMDDFLPINFDL